MADERRDPTVDRRERGDDLPPQMDVREEDLEPHAGLRYIARMFKILSVLLILLLVGEVILGLVREGSSAIPTLLVEATRIVVFACLLWGSADLALMLIESNHDLRATRILVGRINGRVQKLEAMQFSETRRGAPGPQPAGPAGFRGPTGPASPPGPTGPAEPPPGPV